MNVIISILAMTGWWVLLVYGPTYWVNVGHLSEQAMGYLVSGMGLVGFGWCIAIPLISDHVGRKPALILFTVVGLLAPFMMYLAPGSTASMVAYVVLSGSAGGMFPLFLTNIPMETVPAHLVATSSALIMGAGEFVGGAVLTGVVGSFGDRYGLPDIMLISAAILLVVAILGFGLIETKVRAAASLGETVAHL